MNALFLLTFLGVQEIILLLLIVLLLFGGKKIPELMKGLGKGVRDFKDASGKPSESNDRSAESST